MNTSGESENPWVPLSVQEPVTEVQTEELWFAVAGDKLLCRQRLQLPRICMVTGVDVPADVTGIRIRAYPPHRLLLASGMIYPAAFVLPAWLYLPSGILPILVTIVCVSSCLTGAVLLLPLKRGGRGGVVVLCYLDRRIHRKVMLLAACTGLVIPACISLLQSLTPAWGGMAQMSLLLPLVPVIVFLMFLLWGYLFPGLRPSSMLRSDGFYELQGLSHALLLRLQQSAERKA